ncbi:unnamed protein product [Cuscuta epithymum]|uniref:CCHC-type domain-containing protein n=1 Tax=Cuscuta epithymum TaxID=186058 RepID=A0AAV0G6N9_9ASTE|nr:unnamed protein product [Cuscuta epithymum]CAH9143565.1 unnamed protein product [Cuscuta epithymum]
MDGGGRVTRKNLMGRAPVATGQGSRGASRVSRGASRGGRSHTVSGGHVDTEDETYWSYEDSTYQPETEPVETPYEGDDDDVSDDEEENNSLARIEALLQQYHREREERRERRRRRAGQPSGGASGVRSHADSRTHIEPHGGRGDGGPTIRISKYIKEARDLGCKPFDGTGDISIAAQWIKRLNEAALDMQLTPEFKLRVAVRLLEGMASTWWDGAKGKYGNTVTWENFRQEFFAQYYSDFEVNVKRREYTLLTQGGKMTVRQLEHKFRGLAEFIPEYVCDENRMVNHFWDALDLEVRERATQLPNMTFSQVVEQGLKGEKQWEERKRRDAEEAKKRKGESHGPQGSNKKGNHGGGSFRTPPPPPRGNQGPNGQGSRTSGVARCNNCKRSHFGKCRDPPRCFQCGDAGHLKTNCPQLGGARSSGPSSGATGSRNQAGGSQVTRGQGGASASNAPSVNQGRTQARVYAMTEADARANPDSVAGNTLVRVISRLILIIYVVGIKYGPPRGQTG